MALPSVCTHQELSNNSLITQCYTDSMYPLTSLGVVQLEDEGSSGYNAGTSRKKIPEEEEEGKNQVLINSLMTEAENESTRREKKT